MKEVPILRWIANTCMFVNNSNTLYSIATIIFYVIIVAALALIIITLGILAGTPLFIVAYAIAIVVAICFFVVFPMGFTIYGCLILKFGTVQKKVYYLVIFQNC